MVAPIELFANQGFPTAVLAAAISALQTTCVVSNTANFPDITESGQQFRMAIQDTANSSIEIVLVTGVSGSTFTIVRGIEGSSAASHISGAFCGQVLTQYHAQNMFPQSPRVITSGTSTELQATDQVLEIDLGSAATFTLNIDPTILLPGKIYTIVDAGNTAAPGTPINLTALSGEFSNYLFGESVFPMTIAGQTTGIYSNGTNLRLVN